MKTALYRHFDMLDALLYVGITDRLPRRDCDHRRSSDWHSLVSTSRTTWFDTRAQALVAEKTAIAKERPRFNVVHNFSLSMDKPETASQIVTMAGGVESVALDVGISLGRVRNAVSSGTLPASWLDVLERRCKSKLPHHLFSFKGKPE